MKIIILLAWISVVVSYDDIDDKVHYEDIVSKPDVLEHQINCFIDKGPCDELEIKHKHHITEEMTNACAKCSEAHKHNAKVFYHGMKDIFPELYQEFKRKYDPENKYSGHIIEEIEKF